MPNYKFSEKEKFELVMAMVSGEDRADRIASRHRIDEKILYCWEEEFILTGYAAMTGSSDMKTAIDNFAYTLALNSEFSQAECVKKIKEFLQLKMKNRKSLFSRLFSRR